MYGIFVHFCKVLNKAGKLIRSSLSEFLVNTLKGCDCTGWSLEEICQEVHVMECVCYERLTRLGLLNCAMSLCLMEQM